MSYCEEYIILRHLRSAIVIVIDVQTRIKYIHSHFSWRGDQMRFTGGLSPLLQPNGKPMQISEEELEYLKSIAVDAAFDEIKWLNTDPAVSYIKRTF